MSIILWSFFLFFTIILSSLTNITTLASFSSLHADECIISKNFINHNQNPYIFYILIFNMFLDRKSVV